MDNFVWNSISSLPKTGSRGDIIAVIDDKGQGGLYWYDESGRDWVHPIYGNPINPSFWSRWYMLPKDPRDAK